MENDEVCYITTKSLQTAVYPVYTTVSGVDANGEETVHTLACDLLLTFNDAGECTVTSGTTGYTASGTGKFVEKGEKKSWGDTDRNALYLEYEVDFNVRKFVTKDTLVVQSRGISLETFTPSYVE